ncbi:MAG: hypothetical protein Q8K31_05240 [Burkholderiaceae bacterium]|nr:hypothetical protein [Burkholderiaceae bacterium]MDP1968573.1 hypothetical protein [Burkholderiaceae bacterium]
MELNWAESPAGPAGHLSAMALGSGAYPFADDSDGEGDIVVRQASSFADMAAVRDFRRLIDLAAHSSAEPDFLQQEKKEMILGLSYFSSAMAS